MSQLQDAPGTTLPVLDDPEQEAMDYLAAFMKIVCERWGLRRGNSHENLGVELAAAVHVLQGFVIQHMLQRLAPEHWGSWYSEWDRSSWTKGPRGGSG